MLAPPPLKFTKKSQVVPRVFKTLLTLAHVVDVWNFLLGYFICHEALLARPAAESAMCADNAPKAAIYP
jgi:hypothetical protein